ncbi:MAG: glycosyltransferase [Proteobacteria bacterium]|nr:glycosyltransferase [Pseudomonadota bacterium]
MPAAPTLDGYVRERSALSCPMGGRSLRRPQPVSERDLVTIVTVTFNSEKFLLKTIDSIAAQTHRPLEYIVVDGGSRDETLQVLRRREEDIDLWLSEPDRGIGDAFNKGIALARGEFIALVNSDDWLEAGHVSRAVEHLRRSKADFAFGDVIVHDVTGAARYSIMGDPSYFNRVRHAMPDINHPTVVCRRQVYERHGLYDPSLRIAMDYEWLLRGYVHGVRGLYVPDLTSHMLGAGVSNRQGRLALAEVRNVSILYGYPPRGAWVRFIARATRLEVRRFLERWISQTFAAYLRSILHSRYRVMSGMTGSDC